MTTVQAKPVIQQVMDILHEQIRSGEFELSGKLPPESQLARQLQVSRTTLRTALARLEAEGLITRRQGNGTFINKRVMEISSSIGEIWDFRCMIEESGRTPTVRNLGITLRLPGQPETSALELDPGERVLELLRLYLADDVPVIYSSNVFPERLFQEACAPEDMDVSLPIHVLLKTYFGQAIAYSISDLSAGTPDSAAASGILNVPSSCPMLVFHDIFYNENDLPLMLGQNLYNDKHLRIRMARSWG